MSPTRLALLAVLSLVFTGPAWGDELDQAQVDAAIEKGIEWLRGRQAPDGSFDEGYRSMFPVGPTALTALTFAKAGLRDDEVVERAFTYMGALPPRRTYGTGILLMAIEALNAPTPAQLEESKDPYKTLTRKRFRKGPKGLKRLVGVAAKWLVDTRHAPLWGYPFAGGDGFPPGNEWDHSNTQYALLGLGAASRLGFKPPPRDLLEVLEQMLAGQEQAGPDVEPFFVPAAEASIEDLDDLAKQLAEQRDRARRGKPDETVVRIRDFYETHSPGPMKARGWSYFPVQGGPANSHPGGSAPQMKQANNGMTAASLAAVIVLKALLEKTKGYERRYRERVDQAIRDGAAYLAKNWTLEDAGHPYYYLYGLERVGVLTGCERFGEHDWYVEGGRKILQAQSADGSWGSATPVANGGLAVSPNALPQTCFSILFLTRSTVPLVPDLPERPRTGRGSSD